MHVPRGFRLAGVHCGIKAEPEAEDLSLIVCDRPVTAAGVYTENIIYAAPVALDRQRTPSAQIRAVVVNSGNANACTGQRGMQDAREMARLAAEAVGADPQHVLVMSTGIIGRYLPMEKIGSGIRSAAQRLGTEPQHLEAAARGMLTTDRGLKTAHRQLELAGATVHITGMAKGAGMIGPRMATMLALVMTDASLDPEQAQGVLRAAVADSFNCISVEGHMSTNDTVLLLASGSAAEVPAEGAQPDGPPRAFQAALTDLCVELAKKIPADGEGASHLICIRVSGCATAEDAHLIAKTIASSNLVKTAVAGADPNWGRIVSAAGYAGIAFDPRRLQLSINGHLVYRDGVPGEVDEAVVSQSIAGQPETHIELQLDEGPASARFWTSDLTVDYVRFNADYHT